MSGKLQKGGHCYVPKKLKEKVKMALCVYATHRENGGDY